MNSLIWIIIGILFTDYVQSELDEENWWQKANLYQIYPRSFKDSDGDGLGDINGTKLSCDVRNSSSPSYSHRITQQLSYLKEIGVTATWLSPIFKSPMVDFGYDISDFFEIDPLFGTMEDFGRLIERAKELDIKIILDFVPNHSSDECEWFKKSVAREKGYEDFYLWHEGFEDPKNKTNRLPPSNWLSVFRGSAWTWNEKRKEFFMHQFTAQQPDFNFRSKKVHEKMTDVLNFWLEKGVSGFRIDAVPHIYECETDKHGNFINEERNKDVDDPDDYGYLNHTCTRDQPETTKLMYEWREVMDKYQKQNKSETKVLFAEAYSDLKILKDYYGKGDIKGAHIAFNFAFISYIDENSNAEDYLKAINDWMEIMTEGRTSNWVVGNHDKSRVGSRLGLGRIDMINMIVMTLPGISVTYQGEEIGMENVYLTWEETVDPSACNAGKKLYQQFSRDPVRTPFQWNDGINAGFSTSNSTWLPVGTNFRTCNVKHQRSIAKSHLNVYKGLVNLRNDPAFRDSVLLKIKAINKNVLAFLRDYHGTYFVTLVNLNNNLEYIDLVKTFSESTFNFEFEEMQYIIVTSKSPHSIGEKALTEKIVLMPLESVVLISIENNF